MLLLLTKLSDHERKASIKNDKKFYLRRSSWSCK